MDELRNPLPEADVPSGARPAEFSGPLLSIHLSSNRPSSFVEFLDRLQASTADKSQLEVAVKIDDKDEPMNRLLEREVSKRPFRITYISTPLEGGFFGLWRCYDDLLRTCHPKAYFVMGLNDEMGFKTDGWDKVLRKYVGLFPDHIFRLRTSSQRNRNYYDFWEAGFANDTSAIMTKRWLDLGGGWCPCNGPDSFQQCVAFYFGWLDHFRASRAYREFAIYDIEFLGHGANIGLSSRALRRRLGGSIRPWFTLMSHSMQQEAARRAQKLHAHIWATEQGLTSYDVVDNGRSHCVEVVNAGSNLVLHTLPYKLSATRIWLTNAMRRFHYVYYGGGGKPVAGSPLSNAVTYLRWRYPAFDTLAEEYYAAHGERPSEKSRSYYVRRGLIRMLLVWPKRAMYRSRTGRPIWAVSASGSRGVEILVYQVELLRQIYRDPAAPSPINKVWKNGLYRGLVFTFAIWPKQIVKTVLRRF